jgi:YbbR domain-containing protein
MRIVHLIFDHWIAKLLSLLLAFGLWTFVVNTGYRQAVWPDPISVQARDITQGLAVASVLPTIEVEVYAPTASFQRLSTADMQAFVNLAGLPSGTHTLEIKVFADDPNVRILNIEPSLTDVTLEKQRTEKFDLKFETEGELGQGYVADRVELDPDKVNVTGASSLLKQIDQVVIRLNLNGETSTVEKSLAPQALDKDRNPIQGLVFDPVEVQVKLPVIQAEDAKSVGIQVQTKNEPADGFFVGSIKATPSTTTAQGSSKALSEITVLKTEPIDLSGASASFERTVKLVLPPNVRADPQEVNVKVEIKAGSLSADFTVTPEVVNLESGRAATVDPTSVRVTLTGPADQIREIQERGPRLQIDVSGRGVGEHNITLTREMLGVSGDVRASFSVGSVTVRIV